MTAPIPTNPTNVITQPIVHPTKPTFPTQNTITPTPTIIPNPLEDKVKLLESELSNLRNTLSSKSELEQDLMQPQPMFDLSQLTSLLQPPQPQLDDCSFE